MGRNWDSAELFASKGDDGRVHILLEAGDSAPIPGTTKRHFTGPGWIVYQVYPDGGMELVGFADGMVVYRPQPR